LKRNLNTRKKERKRRNNYFSFSIVLFDLNNNPQRINNANASQYVISRSAKNFGIIKSQHHITGNASINADPKSQNATYPMIVNNPKKNPNICFICIF